MNADRFQAQRATDAQDRTIESCGDEVGQHEPKAPAVGQWVEAEARVGGGRVPTRARRQDRVTRMVYFRQRASDLVPPELAGQASLLKVRVGQQGADGLAGVDFLDSLAD